MKWPKSGPVAIVLAVAAMMAPEQAFACSVCFGDKGSTMVQSAGMGILTLLIITLGMLGGIAAFFFVLARRARKYALEAGQLALLAEEDSHIHATGEDERPVHAVRHRRNHLHTREHVHDAAPSKRRFSVS